MRPYSEALFTAVSGAIRESATGTQVGIVVDGVWENAAAEPEGTQTAAQFTALSGGNADTKKFVPEKLADFVALRPGGYTDSGPEPFPEVAQWWSKVAPASGLPLYVIYPEDKVCTDAPGFSSPDELSLIHISPTLSVLPENAEGRISRSAAQTVLREAAGYGAMVLGCGLGLDADTEALVRGVLPHFEGPLVLDADGINALAHGIDILREAPAKVILTPHEGEMARLCRSTIEAVHRDREGAARTLAKDYGVWAVSYTHLGQDHRPAQAQAPGLCQMLLLRGAGQV